MAKKIALIFGITGQDGSYLADLLLKKNMLFMVLKEDPLLSILRKLIIFTRIHIVKKNFILLWRCDGPSSVSQIIKTVRPNEIYNLAAQSHVAVSFEVPEYTANADGLGVLRILEAIKFHKLEKYTKFYQAGTSEMYGNVQQIPQTEKLIFIP